MWLHIPESYRCVQEGEDLTSGSDLLFQTLARSATWKTKSLPPQSWSRTWKRAGWTTRLFGQTYEHSTAQRGVGRWISSLAGTPVSPSLTLASASEPLTTATSGPQLNASYEMFSPSGASSRTSVLICDSDSVKSPEAYTRWATKLRQHCLQRRKSALRTAASGSSSWPTAQAHDSVGGKTPEQVATMRLRTGAGVSNLNEAAAAWPTPDSAQGGRVQSEAAQARGQKAQIGLANAAAMRPTARSTDGTKGGQPRENTFGGLAPEAVMWGTPTSRDGKDGTSALTVPENGLLGRQDPRMTMDGDESSPGAPTSRRRLNPKFAEWQLGWPEGWVDLTSCTSSETA